MYKTYGMATFELGDSDRRGNGRLLRVEAFWTGLGRRSGIASVTLLGYHVLVKRTYRLKYTMAVVQSGWLLPRSLVHLVVMANMFKLRDPCIATT